ncbi:hypothetical protein C8Q77DRAFT_819697 [Trametes polyzona]|nr:hypothetical protein C8Q77DRAFT_819697 [Trametes polyzona]
MDWLQGQTPYTLTVRTRLVQCRTSTYGPCLHALCMLDSELTCWMQSESGLRRIVHAGEYSQRDRQRTDNLYARGAAGCEAKAGHLLGPCSSWCGTQHGVCYRWGISPTGERRSRQPAGKRLPDGFPACPRRSAFQTSSRWDPEAASAQSRTRSRGPQARDSVKGGRTTTRPCNAADVSRPSALPTVLPVKHFALTRRGAARPASSRSPPSASGRADEAQAQALPLPPAAVVRDDVKMPNNAGWEGGVQT